MILRVPEKWLQNHYSQTRKKIWFYRTNFHKLGTLIQWYFWMNKALISVTLSWLNLLSNVRKFPFLGIYVVMFTDVLQTFLKFSIICALFIIAFALGFYAVFAEQVCYRLTRLTWPIHTSFLPSKWNLYLKIQFLA